MDVTGTTSRARTTAPSGTAAQPTARPADTTTPTTTGGAVALRADTVQISGPSMVASRLYRGTVITYTPGNGPASGTIYGFLTPGDRDLLAGLYEHAQTQGIDLEKVDHLAFDLGNYRSEPPGVVKYDDPGASYDTDGNLQPIAFSPTDETIAQRILTSKAIKDSAVPEDFLRYELTPQTGTDKATDFTFLEQAVHATSPTGSDGATDPDAVLAPRSAQYFHAQQIAHGEILTPEQVKHLAAGHPADPPAFSDCSDRIPGLGRFLGDDDKNLLACLYDATASRYGPTSSRMKSVDRLARTLATLHLAARHDADQASGPAPTPPVQAIDRRSDPDPLNRSR